MAVDQAILEQVDSIRVPTLRFYAWSPATLSLGYFQSIENRQEHTDSQNVPIVRRSSGGGAILHHHEITYSMVFPSKDRWSNRNAALYRLAHQAISHALLEFETHLQSFDPTVHEIGNSNAFLCFNRRTEGDLVLGRHKVVGSAQRRSKNALLQHGSILLSRSEFAPQLPGIFDLAAIRPEIPTVLTRLVDQFCEILGFVIESDELTSDELNRAQQIRVERFDSLLWTEKKRKIR